jgi:hypothetical protein
MPTSRPPAPLLVDSVPLLELELDPPPMPELDELDVEPPPAPPVPPMPWTHDPSLHSWPDGQTTPSHG